MNIAFSYIKFWTFFYNEEMIVIEWNETNTKNKIYNKLWNCNFVIY